MTSVDPVFFGGAKSFGQLKTGARPIEGLLGALRWRSTGRLLWHLAQDKSRYVQKD